MTGKRPDWNRMTEWRNAIVTFCEEVGLDMYVYAPYIGLTDAIPHRVNGVRQMKIERNFYNKTVDHNFGDVVIEFPTAGFVRSEEHTSELQSRENLVCRLLLEKKKKIICR